MRLCTSILGLLTAQGIGPEVKRDGPQLLKLLRVRTHRGNASLVTLRGNRHLELSVKSATLPAQSRGSAVQIVDPANQLGGLCGLDVQIEDEAGLPASRKHTVKL